MLYFKNNNYSLFVFSQIFYNFAHQVQIGKDEILV